MHQPLNKRLLFKSIALISTLLIYSNCHSQKKLSENDTCSTKYPILLVHGVSFRDDVPVLKYWGSLPKALKRKGAKVYLSNQNAYNSHVENALQLRVRVLEILHETGSEKVNIIAHSKGGIETRYMITKLGMADKVASLTTLATPHRGSYIADTLIKWLTKTDWLDRVIFSANRVARFIGDENPDALQAANNLTIDYMENFNNCVPNSPLVYYQSYGGIVTEDYPAGLVRFQQKILSEKEGDNDCTVSLKSYQWGNFKGFVKSDQDFGVSHFDILGMKFVSKQSTFDAKYFLTEIVMDLKERGF